MKTFHITKTHRNLPHWYREASIHWVTFRLADSIPQENLKKWRRARETWLSSNPPPWSDEQWQEYHQYFGDAFDKWLDVGVGSCILRQVVMRREVEKALLHFQGQRCKVHHTVIMPNHVHLLIEPLKDYALGGVLKSMKGFSAVKCNELLGRKGPFWMAESYDHIVRSAAQYNHYVEYIKQIPTGPV